MSIQVASRNRSSYGHSFHHVSELLTIVATSSMEILNIACFSEVEQCDISSKRALVRAKPRTRTGRAWLNHSKLCGTKLAIVAVNSCGSTLTWLAKLGPIVIGSKSSRSRVSR